jgi:hypothetical protein
MTRFATEPTPLPEQSWANLDPKERLDLVRSATALTEFREVFDPVSALPSGFVYVVIIPTLSAAERGVMLRRYEKALKGAVGEALTVWCEPIGDKSALRKLRGIEVKAL